MMATRKIRSTGKKSKAEHSAAAMNAAVDDGVRLIDKLMAEKKAILSETVIEQIDGDLSGGGVHARHRRMALGYLSRPFKETAKKMRDDRDMAIAFAAAAVCVRSSVEKYKALVEMMVAADTRIRLALCRRADMKEILALADAETDLTKH